MEQSIGVNLIIKLMSDVERLALKQKDLDKKQYVISQIQSLMPVFYENHHLMLDAIIDGIIIVANNPHMVQMAKSCCVPCFK